VSNVTGCFAPPPVNWIAKSASRFHRWLELQRFPPVFCPMTMTMIMGQQRHASRMRSKTAVVESSERCGVQTK
jgi:hypothetical protein